MWTKEYLRTVIQAEMSDYRLIVASNRQPYTHVLKAGKLVGQREPGGLVTALMPVLEAVHGTWVATGSSPFDREAADAAGRVMLPPEGPAYTLRRIFLTKEERDAYYYGYCNEGLWPLAHAAYTRPVFEASDWEVYERINRKFAETILDEAGGRKAFVWVQDFHLMTVAKYLREAGASNIVTSLFLHIPWPNSEVFRICPQRQEILTGLLAYDLLGFQIRYHGDNFLATVDREVESRIDREKISVCFQGHETLVRAFPISVDFERISRQAEMPQVGVRAETFREEFGIAGKKLLLGVDRIDYTKGIPDRFRAIDRFLEKYPAFREKIVFIEIGQVSRIHIQSYKTLNDELNSLVEQINWKHSQGSWVPIILKRGYMSYEDILALYRLADACVVSSLHDGMNLVSKEFVSARTDQSGVLILSEFAGASREMTDAIIVNPYDRESFADAFYQALTMTEEEKTRRMAKMREGVAHNNIYRWAGKALSQLLKFEFKEV